MRRVYEVVELETKNLLILIHVSYTHSIGLLLAVQRMTHSQNYRPLHCSLDLYTIMN